MLPLKKYLALASVLVAMASALPTSDKATSLSKRNEWQRKVHTTSLQDMVYEDEQIYVCMALGNVPRYSEDELQQQLLVEIYHEPGDKSWYCDQYVTISANGRSVEALVVEWNLYDHSSIKVTEAVRKALGNPHGQVQWKFTAEIDGELPCPNW